MNVWCISWHMHSVDSNRSPEHLVGCIRLRFQFHWLSLATDCWADGGIVFGVKALCESCKFTLEFAAAFWTLPSFIVGFHQLAWQRWPARATLMLVHQSHTASIRLGRAYLSTWNKLKCDAVAHGSPANWTSFHSFYYWLCHMIESSYH